VPSLVPSVMALYEGVADPPPLDDGVAMLPATPGGTGGLEDELDFSDDEVLLDWEQYAGMRRTRLCGGLCATLPWLPSLPPSWWYRYSRRQRKLLTSSAPPPALESPQSAFHSARSAFLLWITFSDTAEQGFRSPGVTNEAKSPRPPSLSHGVAKR
jgi:hypothetical protein